ncbi:MAG: hypothetical protein ACREBS_07225, partial [Nitrososphaerales archaeon]
MTAGASIAALSFGYSSSALSAAMSLGISFEAKLAGVYLHEHFSLPIVPSYFGMPTDQLVVLIASTVVPLATNASKAAFL